MADQPEKGSGWKKVVSVSKSVRSVGYTLFVLFILYSVASMFVGGAPSGHLDMSKPDGWQRVHEQTTFTVDHSFKASMNPALLDAEAQSIQKANIPPPDKVVAVIRFNGDVEAHGADAIARDVDELIVNKDLVKEAVVVVNSPGGTIIGYGQIFAELVRLRQAGIPLTVCIDQMAASGGYMMSLPANKIIAAPLAIVGSVGVVSEFLNYSDLLKSLGIQSITITAGKYKRTVTPTGPVTPEGMAKEQQEATDADALFLGLVKKYRPNANIDLISTADHWFAQQSVDQKLGLVDEIGTSSAYLLQERKTNDIVYLSEKQPRSSGLGSLFGLIDHAEDHFIDHLLTRVAPQGMQ